MRLKNNQLYSVFLTIFAISIIFTAGFITGCGDEGDSATDMVTDDDDMMVITDVDPVTEIPDEEEPVATVSYSEDIEPILSESCALTGCHAANPSGGLDLRSYDTFKVGGASGDAFIVGDGEGSRVVQLIENGSMPLGGTPLTADQIQLFIDWIDEGAENN